MLGSAQGEHLAGLERLSIAAGRALISSRPPGNSWSSRTPPPSEWRKSTRWVNYAKDRELNMSSTQTYQQIIQYNKLIYPLVPEGPRVRGLCVLFVKKTLTRCCFFHFFKGKKSYFQVLLFGHQYDQKQNSNHCQNWSASPLHIRCLWTLRGKLCLFTISLDFLFASAFD